MFFCHDFSSFYIKKKQNKRIFYLFSIIHEGKLDKNDWQLNALEKKIEENQNPYGLKDPHDNKVPKWNRDAFTDKVRHLIDWG